MDVLMEIEAMRKRVLQEINTEFDMIIDKIAKNNKNIKIETQPQKIIYPLTVGPFMFKGEKPTEVIIDDKSYKVKTWKELVQQIMVECIKSETIITRMYEYAGNVSGQKRVLLDTTPNGMRSPIEITDNIYMETHYDTSTLLNILINRILLPIGYDVSRISVVLRNR